MSKLMKRANRYVRTDPNYRKASLLKIALNNFMEGETNFQELNTRIHNCVLGVMKLSRVRYTNAYCVLRVRKLFRVRYTNSYCVLGVVMC